MVSGDIPSSNSGISKVPLDGEKQWVRPLGPHNRTHQTMFLVVSPTPLRSAYLYGKLDEEIYMEQPKGFAVPGQERKVLRLWRALYGLKQAGLAWWRTLDESLKELGFERLKSEAGIFFYKKKGTNIVIGIIYVDDALFCGPNKAVVDAIKVQFMRKWECRDLGEPNEFL